MSSCAFSVVVPMYNKVRYIRATLESVLAQDHDEFEVIVVDDGSTDGSSEAISDILDPRVRIIFQENQGVAAARNRGVAASRHPWIAFLDADDLWKSCHLSELDKVAKTHPSTALIGTATKLIWRANSEHDLRCGSGSTRLIDYFWEAVKNIHVLTSSSVALRRDAFETIGGFRDYRPGEDIDCWVRLALDWPVARSTRATALYLRDTGGQMDDWKRPRPGEKIWLIHSIEDFGGTVKTLHQALATGRYEDKRKSIQKYMDARILSNARKSLTWGDTGATRQRLSFVHNKWSRQYLFYWTLAALPASIIPTFIAGFRIVRRRLTR